MSADVVVANFLRVAKEDLDGARALAAAANNRNAVYLCEQAAEKIIRYPSPQGRIKAAPAPTELAKYIADVGAALEDAVVRFGVDLSMPNAPAKSPGPAR